MPTSPEHRVEPIEDIEAKCRAVEAAIEQATENATKINATKTYGDVKAEFYTFFNSSIILKDLYPYHYFERDNHHSTSGLLKAIPLARERLEASHSASRTLLAELRPLLQKAQAIQQVKIDKRQAKRDALELIDADKGAANEHYRANRSWVMRKLRASHTSSKTLADALRLLPGAASDSTIQTLILQLDLFAEKTETKKRINTLLSSNQACFGDLRPRKYIRLDHTPLADLIEILQKLETQLDDAGHQSKLDKLTEFNERLVERKRLKVERETCVKEAKRLQKSLAQNQKNQQAMLAQMVKQLEEEERLIAGLRTRSLESSFSGSLEEFKILKLQEGLRRLRLCEEIIREFNTALEDSELTSIYAFLANSWSNIPTWDNLNQQSTAVLKLEFHLHNSQREVEALTFTTENADTEEERANARTRLTEVQRTYESELEEHKTLQNAYESALEQRLEADTLYSILTGEEVFTPPPLTEAPSRGTSIPTGFRKPSSDALVAQASTLLAQVKTIQHSKRMGLLKSFAKKSAHIARLQKAMNERAALEVDLDSRNKTRIYIQERLETIDSSLTRCKSLWKAYRDTNTLVMAIRAGDDIQKKLNEVTSILCGGKTGPDAMGKLNVFFMLEAGVKAGFELGFVNLSAKVGVALGLGGTLEITESRELIFSFHVSVFFCAKAEASCKLSDTPLGDSLPTPDLLVEASAQCGVNLFDYRGVRIYENENHWAAHWSYGIAKRLAFLNGVSLTRAGLARNQSTWLEEELNKLRTKNDVHPWLTTTLDQIERPPRSVGIRMTSGRVTGQVSGKAGETEKEKVLGSKAAATFELSTNGVLLAEVEEDAINYKNVNPPKKTSSGDSATTDEEAETPTPPTFIGASTYHVYAHKDSTRRHRYLEVEELEHHTAAYGDLKIATGATSNRSLSSVQKNSFKARRKLAHDLEALPTTGFTNRVEVPPKLLESFQATTSATASRSGSTDSRPARLEKLEQTIRYRLDILSDHGEKSKLEKLKAQATELDSEIQSYTELAAKPQGWVDKARESSASSGMSGIESALDSAESLTKPLEDLGTKYSQAKEKITDALSEAGIEIDVLDKSQNVYTRYFESTEFDLNAAQDGLIRRVRWVSQVYRGLNKTTLSFSAEQTIPILPAVSVYFEETLKVEGVSSSFEVLGLETWSYLKMIQSAFIHAPDAWDAYTKQHSGEIFDLCERASDPTSPAFAEVAEDALNGTTEMQAAANAFGEAAWSFFNRRKNPFEGGISDDKIVEALKPPTARPDGYTRREALDPTPNIPPLPKPKAPEDQPAFKTGFIEDLFQRLTATTREGSDDFQRAIQVGPTSASSKRQGRNKYAETVELGFSYILESTTRFEYMQPIVERLPKRRSVPELGFAEKIKTDLDAVLLKRSKDLTELMTATRPLTQAPLPTTLSERHEILGRVKDLLQIEYSSLASMDRAIRAWLGHPFTFSLVDAIAEQDSIESAINAIQSQLQQDLRRLLECEPGLPTLPEWTTKSGEGIPFYISRSSSTKELDKAVKRYQSQFSELHTALASSPQTGTDAVKQSLKKLYWQAGVVKELDQTVTQWSTGRDPKSSRRMPHVVTFLEIPAKTYLLKIAILTELTWLNQRVTELLNFERYIDEAIAAYEDYAARTIQHAWKSSRMLRTAKEAHRTKVEQSQTRETRAAKLIQRGWRANRARTMNERRDHMLEALTLYLKVGSEQFRNEALAFGRHKQLAPNQTMAVAEVEWRDPEKATSGQAPTPSTSKPAPSPTPTPSRAQTRARTTQSPSP